MFIIIRKRLQESKLRDIKYSIVTDRELEKGNFARFTDDVDQDDQEEEIVRFSKRD